MGSFVVLKATSVTLAHGCCFVISTMTGFQGFQRDVPCNTGAPLLATPLQYTITIMLWHYNKYFTCYVPFFCCLETVLPLLCG